MTPQQKRLARDVASEVRNATWRSGRAMGGGSLRGAFTMERETYLCGTPACLAGWTVARAHAKGLVGPEIASLYNPQDQAGELLGLGKRQRRALFMPMGRIVGRLQLPGWCGYRYLAQPGEPGFITPEHAAACLEHLAETGRVDWAGTAPKTQEHRTSADPQAQEAPA